MISTNIDLGQILVATLVAVVGWFLKREINQFGKRIDLHDKILFELAGSVQKLIGQYEIMRTHWNGSERRK